MKSLSYYHDNYNIQYITLCNSIERAKILQLASQNKNFLLFIYKIVIYKAPGSRHPLSPIGNIKIFYCGLHVKQAVVWITSLASSSCMSEKQKGGENTEQKLLFVFCLFVMFVCLFFNERNSFHSRKDLLILIYLNTELSRRDQIQSQFGSGERASPKTHSFRKKEINVFSQI